MKLKHLLLAAGAMLASPGALAAPAFPGAEGAGATAVGGRGGVVYQVTNLNDSGTGSLRACVQASGPRTCVFRVGGTINLTSGLWVDDPFLTVAGQTAPGGGIQIRAKGTTQSAVMIAASDVIWRYTRIRHGYVSGGKDKASNVMVFNPSQRVIFDHNSTAWNQDEGMGAWSSAGPAIKDLTFSWNIVAEGLADHSTGWITGSETRALSDAMTDVDYHHNLTMNNSHRNPLIKNKRGRWVNNLNYNTRFYDFEAGGGVHFDIIANKWKVGPLWHQGDKGHEVLMYPAGNSSTPNGSPSLYLEGNSSINGGPTSDQSVFVSLVSGENGNEVSGSFTQYLRSGPLPAQAHPITAVHVDQLEAAVLPAVGAYRRLACDGSWIGSRDSTDARLVSQYQNNSGVTQLVANETNVGGFPAIANGTPCVDNDRDGMPSVWEAAQGLSDANAADRNGDLDADGFTNLEEYLAGN